MYVVYTSYRHSPRPSGKPSSSGKIFPSRVLTYCAQEAQAAPLLREQDFAKLASCRLAEQRLQVNVWGIASKQHQSVRIGSAGPLHAQMCVRTALTSAIIQEEEEDLVISGGFTACNGWRLELYATPDSYLIFMKLSQLKDYSVWWRFCFGWLVRGSCLFILTGIKFHLSN